jgi:hypothetical protein
LCGTPMTSSWASSTSKKGSDSWGHAPAAGEVRAIVASGEDPSDRVQSLRGQRSREPRDGKPKTFNFLGFTHICSRSRRGVFQLKRQTRRDRMRARLRAIKEELRRRMHESIPLQGKWLGQLVRGYFAYHAVPTNSRCLGAFRHYVVDLWRRSLVQRSQRDRTTWNRMATLAAEFLPLPRILPPWPSVRFAVKHPRWDPGA